jgi:hypothetical protein
MHCQYAEANLQFRQPPQHHTTDNYILKIAESKTCNRKSQYRGRTIAIIYYNEYSKKYIHSCTQQFPFAPKRSHRQVQKLIQKTLQQCNLITDKRKIKYVYQKKPPPPTMKAQLKLHKHNIPINKMNAPTYKTAKHLAAIPNKRLTLNNHYNVKNSAHLATELTKLKLNENHKLITYDIKDLHVNIP